MTKQLKEKRKVHMFPSFAIFPPLEKGFFKQAFHNLLNAQIPQG